MHYWDYIQVEKLLALQNGGDDCERTINKDETLFIVVHQVYELWFKLVLGELKAARDLFYRNPVPDDCLASAARSIKRIVTIFRQAVHHFEIMETLTTRDYLAFRDYLIPASGFQSAQIREIEILLGLEDASRIPLGSEHSYQDALKTSDGRLSPALARVQARIQDGPSLKTVVYDWLARTPINGSSHIGSIDSFLHAVIESYRSEVQRRLDVAKSRGGVVDIATLKDRYDRELQQTVTFLEARDDLNRLPEDRERVRRVRAAIVFIESYRELPRLSWPREVIDGIVELEQSMLIWRQRHARMVERVIGRRTGTGGSAGVDYLDSTALKYRVFSDIWSVRSLLMQQSALPPLENVDDYRFRVEDSG